MIIGHCCVFSWGGDESLSAIAVVLKEIGGPSQGVDVEEAGGVGEATEVSGATFGELYSFTTEDEVLPGGDGLDHDTAMVPSGEVVVDVGVVPLVSFEVVADGVGELGLRVPAAVDVEHVGN